ncbi:hypothetical protein A3K72_01515 [Candidatus Woesearchaeota archaeon RBG_13_36_6]|nr:MAG: hypothetical protein A3K72_01515 [Candidatus Woesearchaeota archaeon RBG_13_36_6]
MKRLLVVGGIIRRDNKMLIAQRLPKSTNALKWEFPGGGFELGEDHRKALVREIKEELGVKIRVKQIYEVVSHTYDFGKNKEIYILIMYFLADYAGGEPKKIRVNDFRWVTKQEIKQFDFCDADKAVVDKIVKEGW